MRPQIRTASGGRVLMATPVAGASRLPNPGPSRSPNVVGLPHAQVLPHQLPHVDLPAVLHRGGARGRSGMAASSQHHMPVQLTILLAG